MSFLEEPDSYWSERAEEIEQLAGQWHSVLVFIELAVQKLTDEDYDRLCVMSGRGS